MQINGVAAVEGGAGGGLGTSQCGKGGTGTIAVEGHGAVTPKADATGCGRIAALGVGGDINVGNVEGGGNFHFQQGAEVVEVQLGFALCCHDGVDHLVTALHDALLHRGQVDGGAGGCY